MSILVIQHVAENTLGGLETVLSARKLPFSYVQSAELTEAQAALEDVSGLIILGGMESVTDERKNPHLVREQAMIRRAVGQNLPVFGICLGSQLLAKALGGSVSRNVYEGQEIKELGWTPIYLHSAGERDPVLRHLEGQAQFQWHEDASALPPGAVHLAESELCPTQAFRMGESGAGVYGVQFHPEVTLDVIAAWMRVSKTVPEARKNEIWAESERCFAGRHEASQRLFEAYCDLAY